VEDDHHALQRQLRSLTEGLDELVPQLPPYERWKRRLPRYAR
jgi:hypothetical protein